MGEKLSRLRNKANLTQLELAQKAGVGLGTIRNWEQNRRVPLLDIAAKVAKALGVSIDDLAGTPPKKGKKSKG